MILIRTGKIILLNFLKNLNASGVYIGKLELKMKEIIENDVNTAHIDEDASLVI
jgi:hypothetical protein